MTDTGSWARPLRWAIVGGWLTLLVCGCQGAAQRPRLQGKVTYRGTPLAGQMLTLVSEGEKGQSFTQQIAIKADGSFSGDVPSPGKYKVAIKESMAVQEGNPAGKTTVVIPAKYRDPDSSQLSWTIEPGNNRRDFELTD